MFLNHKQFMSALNISEIFREFLIKSTAKFTKQQRQLVLNIDEVYVQSDFSYKGGKIFGSSSSNVEVAAKTVLAFMVTSLFEKWSEIVRLYPLASTDAKEVFEMVTTVIADIEKCNLNVVVLCSDNLPLNQNLFKLFSRKHVIEQSVPHPCDPNRPLFLIFYFVHIIKCVRNNWLNQLSVVLFSLLLKILLTLIYQLLYPELPLKILGINTDLSTLPP